MNRTTLPYQHLRALTAMSPDLVGDLRALEFLIDHAVEHDTGGLVPYDIAARLVLDPQALERLNAAGLLHHHYDIAWCGCHAPKSAWHWSIHAFRRLSAPARRHDAAMHG